LSTFNHVSLRVWTAGQLLNTVNRIVLVEANNVNWILSGSLGAGRFVLDNPHSAGFDCKNVKVGLGNKKKTSNFFDKQFFATDELDKVGQKVAIST